MKSSPSWCAWAISPSSNCERAVHQLSKPKTSDNDSGCTNDDKENCASNSTPSWVPPRGDMRLKQVEWDDILSPAEGTSATAAAAAKMKTSPGISGGRGHGFSPKSNVDIYSCQSPSPLPKKRIGEAPVAKVESSTVVDALPADSWANYAHEYTVVDKEMPVHPQDDDAHYQGQDSGVASDIMAGNFGQARQRKRDPSPSAPSPLSDASEGIAPLCDLPTPPSSDMRDDKLAWSAAFETPLERGMANAWSAQKSSRPPPISPSARKWLSSARGDFYSASPRAKMASMQLKMAQPTAKRCLSQSVGALAPLPDAPKPLIEPTMANIVSSRNINASSNSRVPKVLSIRHDVVKSTHASHRSQVRPVLPSPDEILDSLHPRRASDGKQQQQQQQQQRTFDSVPLASISRSSSPNDNASSSGSNDKSASVPVPVRFRASGGPDGLRLTGLVGGKGLGELGLEEELESRVVLAEALLGKVWVLCGQKEVASKERNYAQAKELAKQMMAARNEADACVEKLLLDLAEAEADAVMAEDFIKAASIKEAGERVSALSEGSMLRSEASASRQQEQLAKFDASSIGLRASVVHCTLFWWKRLLAVWTRTLGFMTLYKEFSMPCFFAAVSLVAFRVANGAWSPEAERIVAYAIGWLYSGSFGHTVDATSQGLVMTNGCKELSADEGRLASLLLPNILHGLGRLAIDCAVFAFVLFSLPMRPNTLAKSLGLSSSFPSMGRHTGMSPSASSSSSSSTPSMLSSTTTAFSPPSIGRARRQHGWLTHLCTTAVSLIPSETSNLAHVMLLAAVFEAIGAWSMSLGALSAYCSVKPRTFFVAVLAARVALIAPFQAIASLAMFGKASQAQAFSILLRGVRGFDSAIFGQSPVGSGGVGGPFTRMAESGDWGLQRGFLNVCTGGAPLLQLPRWGVFRALDAGMHGASLLSWAIALASVVVAAVAINGYAVQDAAESFVEVAKIKDERQTKKRELDAKVRARLATATASGIAV